MGVVIAFNLIVGIIESLVLRDNVEDVQVDRDNVKTAIDEVVVEEEKSDDETGRVDICVLS